MVFQGTARKVLGRDCDESIDKGQIWRQASEVLDIQLRYDKEFRCIGPDCEDLCCSNWKVEIDKATYERYKSIECLRPIVDAHVVRTGDGGTARYARIKFLDSTRHCPFLTSERWCRLHKEYGAEYLSPVCFHYPRVREIPAGMTTPPLLLSCPEAARVVLLQQELVPIERNARMGVPTTDGSSGWPTWRTGSDRERRPARL
jgi:lysine-N-methylase